MLFNDLLAGEFISRENRFLCLVKVNGLRTQAHLPNSGKLPGILTPGARIWVKTIQNQTRKTKFDLALVESDYTLISVDGRLPNQLFEEAIVDRRVNVFNYMKIRREISVGESRIDILLTGSDGSCWVETKSVSLVSHGVALFPDSPTLRGLKHISELAKLSLTAKRTAIVFVIQRNDPVSFRPNWEIDPVFCHALIQAKISGVDVRAYTCDVSTKGIYLDREISCII